MTQTVDEILNELRNLVAGRGHEKNYLFDKIYSRKSFIKCIDFSPWVRRKFIENDKFALAVFKAQSSNNPDIASPYFTFEQRIERNEIRIKHLMKFPFREYFNGEIANAELDLKISDFLNYRYKAISRILMAYRLSLRNVERYFNEYNEIKKTDLEPPDKFPNNPNFSEFQLEFRKLPLATRLHLFDILEYPVIKTKRKIRKLSDMTKYDARQVGIDKYESANILRQSKLITSLPDGTGYINPEYAESVSLAHVYAEKIFPAYRQWQGDLIDWISDRRFADEIQLAFKGLRDSKDVIPEWEEELIEEYGEEWAKGIIEESREERNQE